jgi:UDP:flavonoid glycosyltransferase YjiC (YdhE family)
MSTFLIVTHGSGGDVFPFVRIGGELVARGHRVTLLTHAPYRSIALAAGLDFVPIDGTDEYERMLATTPSLLGDQRMSWQDFYQGHGIFDQIRRECDTLLRLHRPGETVLVGRHTSAVSARFVAEILRVPVAWVAVAPSQVMVAPIAAHAYATDLAADFDRLREGLGLPPLIDWHGWFTRSTAEIGLWPAWFDEAAYPSPARITLTGFPLADEDTVAESPAPPIPVIGSGPRPILATGGTGRMLHADYYPTLIAAAGRSGLPTLLAVRHRDLLPDRLPDNVQWYPQLSFPQVMPEVAAVFHHGGIGTCVRGLAAGTPQVLLPDGIDRPDNAARLAHHGLARVVPMDDWGPDAIAGLLHAAVADRDYGARALAVTGGRYADGIVATADRLEELRDAPDLSARVRALGSVDLDRLRARLGHRVHKSSQGGAAS